MLKLLCKRASRGAGVDLRFRGIPPHRSAGAVPPPSARPPTLGAAIAHSRHAEGSPGRFQEVPATPHAATVKTGCSGFLCGMVTVC